MIRIEAENALKMTETEMLDVVFEASENSVVELNVVDPDSQAGDNDGVYLEIINYETELFKLRNQTFSQVDAHHTGKEYETRLVSMLQEGKTLSSYKILQELGVDPNDSDAVRLISNQLEELRRFGLVKETANGWRRRK